MRLMATQSNQSELDFREKKSFELFIGHRKSENKTSKWMNDQFTHVE